MNLQWVESLPTRPWQDDPSKMEPVLRDLVPRREMIRGEWRRVASVAEKNNLPTPLSWNQFWSLSESQDFPDLVPLSRVRIGMCPDVVRDWTCEVLRNTGQESLAKIYLNDDGLRHRLAMELAWSRFVLHVERASGLLGTQLQSLHDFGQENQARLWEYQQDPSNLEFPREAFKKTLEPDQWAHFDDQEDSVITQLKRWLDYELEAIEVRESRAATDLESLNRLMMAYIESVDRVCALSEGQDKKLRLAARVVIRRLFTEETSSVPLGQVLNHPQWQKVWKVSLNEEQRQEWEKDRRLISDFRHQTYIRQHVRDLDEGVCLTGEEQVGLIQCFESHSTPNQASFQGVREQVLKVPKTEIRKVVREEVRRDLQFLLADPSDR